ncbi:MAG TPA: hypothetical protein VMX16_02495 [Terriglobia bacterium]|nr:hypothetical protein [Terriglobia bacterium]
MRKLFGKNPAQMVVAAAFCAAVLFLQMASQGQAKSKHRSSSNPNDPTSRLFHTLDDSYGGKLTNLYLLADVYSDPASPGKQFQRVLLVDYDKSRFFGRFKIIVRSVGKLTPTQLQSYTPQQIYDFGETDSEKFEKINPGPFGGNGDLYLRATGNGPLQSAPIMDHVRQEYDMLVTTYILPAVEKKQ